MRSTELLLANVRLYCSPNFLVPCLSVPKPTHTRINKNWVRSKKLLLAAGCCAEKTMHFESERVCEMKRRRAAMKIGIGGHWWQSDLDGRFRVKRSDFLIRGGIRKREEAKEI